MKNFIYALILSILVHIIIFTLLNQQKIEDRPKPTLQAKKKAHIKYVQLKVEKKPIIENKTPPKVQSKKELEDKEIKKSQNAKPKEKIEKVIKKERAKKTDIEKPIKNEIKESKKITKKSVIENRKKSAKIEKKAPLKNSNISKSEQKETPQKKMSLSDFLSMPADEQMLDEITKSYLALYGDEYEKFTNVQKAFLKENLRDIGKITQIYLRYPDVSVRTNQYGMNIVEFMLYPNGDISEVRMIKGTGYEALDENSIETIEIAYKDYPKPKEPTKIRIYINYLLY